MFLGDKQSLAENYLPKQRVWEKTKTHDSTDSMLEIQGEAIGQTVFAPKWPPINLF